MRGESFVLKWNYYTNSVSSILQNEALDNQFTDVTLVSDDMMDFQVHKFVLSSCSPIMKQLLLQNSHQPDVHLDLHAIYMLPT